MKKISSIYCAIVLLGLFSAIYLFGCGSNPTKSTLITPYEGIIYVTCLSDNSVLVFDGALLLDGLVTPERVISGDVTSIQLPSDVFVDTSEDKLYVTCGAVNRLLVFSNASSANGNVIPSQIIEGLNTTLDDPAALFRKEGKLYVANRGGNSILVFSFEATGDIPPLSTITSESIHAPNDIYVDSNGSLYVSCNGIAGSSREVYVFNNAGSLNGETDPSRVISSEWLDTGPSSIWVDEETDRLFVSVPLKQKVHIFCNASVISGECDPVYILRRNGVSPEAIAYWPMGRSIFAVIEDNSSTIAGWDNITADTPYVNYRLITVAGHSTFTGIAIDPTRYKRPQ